MPPTTAVRIRSSFTCSHLALVSFAESAQCLIVAFLVKAVSATLLSLFYGFQAHSIVAVAQALTSQVGVVFCSGQGVLLGSVVCSRLAFVISENVLCF